MAVRVAVVGLGGIGRNHCRIYKNHPQAELVGVVLEALGEKGARPEQQAQVARCFGRLPEQGGQLRSAVGAGGEAPQPEQAEVGVRGGGEPVEKQGDHGSHEARSA